MMCEILVFLEMKGQKKMYRFLKKGGNMMQVTNQLFLVYYNIYFLWLFFSSLKFLYNNELLENLIRNHLSVLYQIFELSTDLVTSNDEAQEKLVLFMKFRGLVLSAPDEMPTILQVNYFFGTPFTQREREQQQALLFGKILTLSCFISMVLRDQCYLLL